MQIPITNFAISRPDRAAARGFTLVELMLSITLFLVLMVGINYVFRTTSDAVGAGQTINGFSRDSQTAQSLLFDDFHNISKEPPCFIIASQLVNQFLNQDDAQTSPTAGTISADATGGPSALIIGNLAGNISPALTSYRSHRCDLVRFFAHGLYTRRSANEGSFTSSTTSQDAFITIGHAMLPTYDGQTCLGPTADASSAMGSNLHLVQEDSSGPNSLWSVTTDSTGPQAVQRVGSYGSDWVLARSVILLKDPGTNIAASGSDPYAEDGYPRYLNAVNGPFPNVDNTTTADKFIPYGANLTPLGDFTPDTNFGNLHPRTTLVNGTLVPVVSTPLQSSRYDIAFTTPDEFRRAIADEILKWQQWQSTTPPPGTPIRNLWWNPLVYNIALEQTIQTTLTQAASSATVVPSNYYTGNPGFYTSITGQTSPDTFKPPPASATAGPTIPPPDLARVAANPLLQTPLTSAAVAQMAPYFVQHCSQFVVEYSGDYLTQDSTGNIMAIGGDGTADYYVDPTTGQHKTRWYGMPRDVNGDGKILSVVASGAPLKININTTTTSTDTPDVIPLRDYYSALTQTGQATPSDSVSPPWEVDVNFDMPAPISTTITGGTQGDYANQPGSVPLGIDGLGGMNNAFGASNNPPRYVCAWYNDMPAMVRILIKVDDPDNKVKDGPWYEYVFKLK